MNFLVCLQSFSLKYGILPGHFKYLTEFFPPLCILKLKHRMILSMAIVVVYGGNAVGRGVWEL